MSKPRYLTKSRFKLALNCPTKLFYTRKKEYEDSSETDTFLEALAQGGFQVEELARMEYPDGIAILGEDWNYQKLADRTSELLQNENVVIFEAAFLFEGLFIRTDILVKLGNKIKLIEVKAKSIDSLHHDSFISSRGNLGWTDYLYDVAFQKYVMQQCHPEWSITPYLNLVDKSKKTTVDGLNQHFKIAQNSEMRTGIITTPGLTKTQIGDSILCDINVNAEVLLIQNENPLFEAQSFEDCILFFRNNYKNDTRLETPIGKHCKGCEFRIDDDSSENKSGFHECWSNQLSLSQKRISEPKSYDVWNFRGSGNLFDQGIVFMDQIEPHHVNIELEANVISNSERRWLQVEKNKDGDNTPHFEVDGLREEMNRWKYPLNFIDFETTAVAIPFTAGRKPYEQLAFQYSHHIVFEDGTIEHYSEHLDTKIGHFPNFDFVRALRGCLSKNEGSIFRYHNHENTILNKIYGQLLESKEDDKDVLISFIESISHNTGSSARTWSGSRDMIDLFQVVKNYYFHPEMNGSLSIKAVLPAVLNTSELIKEKYVKPISDINLTSKNFPQEYVFLQFENGKAISPYKALPSVYENWSQEQLDNALANIGDIADGGTALTAYAKLQFEDVTQEERDALESALLRYCELDTLAMVMIYEHFKELIES
ncbi:DUF2779 domain-containing protein [Tenacibaculum maritimum]|uniref:DUF2779 domain-containing protein n=1 Tax=Tenacibaculum maritimum TaxID=107401 RepID=UPI00388E1FA0